MESRQVSRARHELTGAFLVPKDSTTPSTECFGEEERRTLLHEHLLQEHDINIPPAGVQVQVAIVFFKIVCVDILTSQLVLNVWLSCLWEDPRLSWDKSTWNISNTVTIADKPTSHTLPRRSWCRKCVMWGTESKSTQGATTFVPHSGA